MKPSNFKAFPMGSAMQKSETEMIARNIMVILARTGDTFRSLTWDEYKEEREKDGNFSEGEKIYFYQVINYCVSPEAARLFSPVWKIISATGSLSPATPPLEKGKQGVSQPNYKGKGNHSVNELEAICEQYKEYVHQINSDQQSPSLLAENESLKKRVKDLEDAAIIDLAFNPAKEENEKLREQVKQLREAANSVLQYFPQRGVILEKREEAAIKKLEAIIENTNPVS